MRFSPSQLGMGALAAAAALSGCCALPAPYQYRNAPGKTALVCNGRAIAPAAAPAQVKAAIEAGNRIAGMPYRRGGGHAKMYDNAYDCSGSTSFVLRSAGLLNETLAATHFRHYGAKGKGDWITIYARKGHVFLVIAGVRFDTGYGHGTRGPRWSTASRPLKGCVPRHPKGL